MSSDGPQVRCLGPQGSDRGGNGVQGNLTLLWRFELGEGMILRERIDISCGMYNIYPHHKWLRK